MSDLRQLLSDRVDDAVPDAVAPYSAVIARRRRHQRRRALVAVGTAAVVVALVAGMIATVHAGDRARPQPADLPPGAVAVIGVDRTVSVERCSRETYPACISSGVESYGSIEISSPALTSRPEVDLFVDHTADQTSNGFSDSLDVAQSAHVTRAPDGVGWLVMLTGAPGSYRLMVTPADVPPLSPAHPFNAQVDNTYQFIVDLRAHGYAAPTAASQLR